MNNRPVSGQDNARKSVSASWAAGGGWGGGLSHPATWGPVVADGHRCHMEWHGAFPLRGQEHTASVVWGLSGAASQLREKLGSGNPGGTGSPFPGKSSKRCQRLPAPELN